MPSRRHSAPCVAMISICAMSLTAACANIEASTMQRIFDSWRGAPVDQAKAQWGPPQSVQAVAGGTAYVWTDEVPTAHPPGSGPRDARLEPPPTAAYCQRKLMAGPDGNVIGGEWSGSACCVQTLIGQCAGLTRKPPQAAS
ncbi:MULTISPECIES: hypothetical protein [unclassified Cupriavidus]|uniref:hypothetical protein n=1 Tax=unclassified Cupriavidus TaxID=2640874 RepID=UPI000888023B|nr:hypothetical protein [Cupriavidus sp. YR651]SDD89666.1 hypothetical protein SAMN05216345_12064 [Cupriavidus sp. YR651]